MARILECIGGLLQRAISGGGKKRSSRKMKEKEEEIVDSRGLH